MRRAWDGWQAGFYAMTASQHDDKGAGREEEWDREVEEMRREFDSWV